MPCRPPASSPDSSCSPTPRHCRLSEQAWRPGKSPGWGTHLAYAFSSRALQNSVRSAECTNTSLPFFVGSRSSTTTSIHCPNCQICGRQGGSQRGVGHLYVPGPLPSSDTHTCAHARARAHHPPFLHEDSVTRAPPGVRFSDTPVTEGPPPLRRRRRRKRKAVKGLNLPPASPPGSAMASRGTHPPFDLGWTFRTSEVLKTLGTFRNIFMT